MHPFCAAAHGAGRCAAPVRGCRGILAAWDTILLPYQFNETSCELESFLLLSSGPMLQPGTGALKIISWISWRVVNKIVPSNGRSDLAGDIGYSIYCRLPVHPERKTCSGSTEIKNWGRLRAVGNTNIWQPTARMWDTFVAQQIKQRGAI